jgi:hypothetical protein
MQTTDFGSMSIDELLAVREEITRTLPAKVNAEKRKQQNHSLPGFQVVAGLAEIFRRQSRCSDDVPSTRFSAVNEHHQRDR